MPTILILNCMHRWCLWHLYYCLFLSNGSRNVLQSNSRAVAEEEVVVLEEEEVVVLEEEEVVEEVVDEMAMLVDSVGRAMGGKC